MQSCQTQQLYHPYFVYQGQLNNATCADEADEAIRMIASKHTSAIFFRDFFRYYYKVSYNLSKIGFFVKNRFCS
jgi:hypothetical protein